MHLPYGVAEPGSTNDILNKLVMQERLMTSEVHELVVDVDAQVIYSKGDGKQAAIFRMVGDMVVFYWGDPERNQQFFNHHSERYYSFTRPALRLVWGNTGVVGIYLDQDSCSVEAHKAILKRALEVIDTDLFDISYKSEQKLFSITLVTPDHTIETIGAIKSQINALNAIVLDFKDRV